MGRLENKVAIITGGSGGIGAATGKLFAAEGAKVLLVDLKEENLRQAAEAIGSKNVKICAADVSKAKDVQRFVQMAVSEFGGLDILFDNAGIEGVVAPLAQTSEENFQRVMDVNLKGVWLAIKESVPHMQKRGGGSIMITSSIAGLRGFAGLGPYVASKHAVIGLMRSAAIELGPLKIRVNTINPGPIDNRMMRSVEEQYDPSNPKSVKLGFETKVPIGRYGTNEEIANMALFLASDESRYCSGNTFVVDGGFTAG